MESEHKLNQTDSGKKEKQMFLRSLHIFEVMSFAISYSFRCVQLCAYTTAYPRNIIVPYSMSYKINQRNSDQQNMYIREYSK